MGLTYLYGSKIKDLLVVYKKYETSSIVEMYRNMVVSESAKKIYNNASDKEKKSWNDGIPVLLELLKMTEFEDLYIYFEVETPLGKRMDAVIVGYYKNEDMPTALIIELKGWESIKDNYDKVCHVTLNEDDIEREHPITQLATYEEQLRLSHSNCGNRSINIKTVAFLYRFKNLDPLFENSYQYLDKLKYKAYNNSCDLQKYLKNFTIKKADKQCELFINGNYEFTDVSFENMNKALNGGKFTALLDDQKDAMCIINPVIKRTISERSKGLKHKEVVIVSGDVGTGKSVLGMDIIRKYVIGSNSRKVYFTFPSKMIKTIVKNECKLGVGNTQYILENSSADLIIIDEAHRLSELKRYMKYALEKFNMIVLLQDDNQCIKFSEEGTVENYKNIFKELKVELGYSDINMTFAHLNSEKRTCYDSGYMEMINAYLQDGIVNKTYIVKNYDVITDKSLKEINSKLYDHEKSDNKIRCQWLAPYCWKWNSRPTNYTDIHIIEGKEEFKKGWNPMQSNETEIINWYNGTDKNHLNQVGCVYTAQGLEYDYVGFIFWDDLFWNCGRWNIDINKSQDDYYFISDIVKFLGGTYSRESEKWMITRMGKKEELASVIKNENLEEKVMEIQKNIYRILMSRATKGIYIWFKDEETKKHFEELLN